MSRPVAVVVVAVQTAGFMCRACAEWKQQFEYSDRRLTEATQQLAALTEAAAKATVRATCSCDGSSMDAGWGGGTIRRLWRWTLVTRMWLDQPPLQAWHLRAVAPCLLSPASTG